MDIQVRCQGKRLALVVGAGGIKCAAAIGAYQVLQRHGIDIDLVVGCSGGSLYAALIALGVDAATSRELTLRLWTSDLAKQRDRVALLRALVPGALKFDQRFGLIKDTRIANRLREIYGENTFADARIPLFVVAADFLTGEKVVLAEGSLFDALRASVAIPFVFKPWRIGDRLLTDGSLADPLPVDVAIKENASIILAIGFDSPPQRRIDSPVRFAFQVTSMMTNNLLRANYAFHNLAQFNEVIPVLPEFDGRVGAFETSRLPHIIERGELAMEQQIPYIKRLLSSPAA
jgi:NTE family protein